MAQQDPKQEILSRLVRLYAIPATAAGEETVHFLRMRSLPGRQVHAVTFKNKSGEDIHFLCHVMQNAQGLWGFRGGAGGEVSSDLERAHLIHEQPWAHLSGGGWPKEFYGGGYIIDKGVKVARVKLIATNGTVVEDTVENGIVLFLTDERVETPLQAELYDYSGNLINSHDVF
ncbi:hypothetical protein [Tengunoibacter tsumagoiensis]|uniref:Uncharacterized protein n=1 Tax=Tengunoibacter tsumagoiensis TaxID=2014871 RepID=A0A402A4J0_9CHLR|nr:hypothetical protein [Tengunoibacter tsumagoiensis]GCE14074.1 hypothetical protein KTT_39330 [Tengunoibacter tsumagoiensis]